MKPVFLLLLMAAILTLSACASAAQPAAEAVESYLNALVTKDEARLTQLTCPDWEVSALLEYDALSGVETRLDGVDCQQTAAADDSAQVTCSGKIVASYGDEDQEFDLSLRTYQVQQSGGDWLVCGY